MRGRFAAEFVLSPLTFLSAFTRVDLNTYTSKLIVFNLARELVSQMVSVSAIACCFFSIKDFTSVLNDAVVRNSKLSILVIYLKLN